MLRSCRFIVQENLRPGCGGGVLLMDNPTYNVLFLCTGNSARSIIAEALLNVMGKGRFRAYSAGSFPSGKVQPIAAEMAKAIGYDEPLRSKSWDEFADANAPKMDFIITVCDNAAGEVCPVWPGQPVTAHWGVPDPAAVTESEEARRQAFKAVWAMLRQRVELLLALPLDKLDRMSLQREMGAIGKQAQHGH
jgi:arsenate reductase